MKWKTFKCACLLMLFIINNASAQENNDSYERRLNKYQERWNKLIPRYAKLQYAGSMGLVSAGIGWNYGKKDQWETDLMIGYIPKYTTDKAKVCITLKENYIPWKLPLKNQQFSFSPLACGLYVNTVIGDDFWIKEPGKYPSSYYKFSTKIRFNICLGQQMTYQIPSAWRKRWKSVTAFYEISTNDLYLISAIGNSNLTPTDYLHLSLGLKMQWF